MPVFCTTAEILFIDQGDNPIAAVLQVELVPGHCFDTEEDVIQALKMALVKWAKSEQGQTVFLENFNIGELALVHLPDLQPHLMDAGLASIDVTTFDGSDWRCYDEILVKE
jgi:hypothetical protein